MTETITIENCNLVVETIISHDVGKGNRNPLMGCFETQTGIIVGIATHTYSTTKDLHEGGLRHVSALSVFFLKTMAVIASWCYSQVGKNGLQ